MKINIKSEKLELTDSIRDYVEKKITALEKFINNNVDDLVVYVIIGKTTEHHNKGDYFKAEVKIDVSHKTFFVKSEKDDLYAAIDDVQNVLKREIVQYKKILMDKHQKSA